MMKIAPIVATKGIDSECYNCDDTDFDVCDDFHRLLGKNSTELSGVTNLFWVPWFRTHRSTGSSWWCLATQQVPKRTRRCGVTTGVGLGCTTKEARAVESVQIYLKKIPSRFDYQPPASLALADPKRPKSTSERLNLFVASSNCYALLPAKHHFFAKNSS